MIMSYDQVQELLRTSSVFKDWCPVEVISHFLQTLDRTEMFTGDQVFKDLYCMVSAKQAACEEENETDKFPEPNRDATSFRHAYPSTEDAAVYVVMKAHDNHGDRNYMSVSVGMRLKLVKVSRDGRKMKMHLYGADAETALWITTKNV